MFRRSRFSSVTFRGGTLVSAQINGPRSETLSLSPWASHTTGQCHHEAITTQSSDFRPRKIVSHINSSEGRIRPRRIGRPRPHRPELGVSSSPAVIGPREQAHHNPPWICDHPLVSGPPAGHYVTNIRADPGLSESRDDSNALGFVGRHPRYAGLLRQKIDEHSSRIFPAERSDTVREPEYGLWADARAEGAELSCGKDRAN